MGTFAGAQTIFTYDIVGRVRTTTDSTGYMTTTDYDALNRPIKITHPDGTFEAMEYDLEGRTTKEIRANGAATTYTYENTTSRLKTRTDRRGVVTTYGYFKDNQLQSRTYSNVVSPVAATGNVAYTYYADTGLPNTVANGTDTLTWAYSG